MTPARVAAKETTLPVERRTNLSKQKNDTKTIPDLKAINSILVYNIEVCFQRERLSDPCVRLHSLLFRQASSTWGGSRVIRVRSNAHARTPLLHPPPPATRQGLLKDWKGDIGSIFLKGPCVKLFSISLNHYNLYSHQLNRCKVLTGKTRLIISS